MTACSARSRSAVLLSTSKKRSSDLRTRQRRITCLRAPRRPSMICSRCLGLHLRIGPQEPEEFLADHVRRLGLRLREWRRREPSRQGTAIRGSAADRPLGRIREFPVALLQERRAVLRIQRIADKVSKPKGLSNPLAVMSSVDSPMSRRSWRGATPLPQISAANRWGSPCAAKRSRGGFARSLQSSDQRPRWPLRPRFISLPSSRTDRWRPHSHGKMRTRPV